MRSGVRLRADPRAASMVMSPAPRPTSAPRDPVRVIADRHDEKPGTCRQFGPLANAQFSVRHSNQRHRSQKQVGSLQVGL
jgi:hypothetical protein